VSKIYIETNKHLGLLRELWSGLIEHSSEKISEYGKFISYDQKEISVELIKIASSLKSLNIDGEPFVIQFISSTDLAGTNIVADEFARSAASLGMGPCLVINCKKNSLKSLDYEQQKISIVQSIEFDHSINKAVWKNTNEEEISYARLIDYNETWQKVY